MDIRFCCNSCGQHVVVDASVGGSTVNCPNCAAQLAVPQVIVEATPPKKGFNVFRMLLLLVLVVGGLFVSAFVVSLATLKPDDEAGQAYYAAKKFCERYAPSATKFTTESGGDYLDGKAQWVTNNGRSDWYACGYVDCQNRFGAMRHQFWGAHVVLTADKWKLSFLAIGEETIIGGD